MITTKGLLQWRYVIANTKSNAEELVKMHEGKMAQYYEHLVDVAEVQLSLIDRLIKQSDAIDKMEK